MRHCFEQPDLPALAFRKHAFFNRPATLEGSGGKGGSAPSAPDPMTVANATTQTNNATAAYNKALNGGNYSNLFGSSQQVQTGTDPNTGAPIYSTQQSANPQLQNLFGLNLGQAGNSTDINNNAMSGIGQLSNGYNTLQNELQGLQGNYSSNNGQLQNIMGQNSGLNQSLNGLNSQYQGLNSSINGLGSQYAGLQSQLGGIGASIDPNAGKAAQQQGQDAAYAAQTQYLDPQFAQGQSSIESQLANQGLTPGSQAYTNAMTNFNNSKQQAYSNAANQSILTGSSIGQQSLNNQLNAANTQAGLVNQQGSMVGNQANLFSQQGSNLGAQAGIYGQQASNLGQQISALGQQSANTGAQAGIYGQQGSNLGQQASLYGQQVGIGQLPYSNASTIGSMIPGYGGSATSASSPANVSQLYQNQYQGQLNNYNQQVGSANSTMSGLFGLGSAGIMATMFSDRRLKTDIEAVTRWADGMNFYRYRYVWDEPGVTRYGFMADEVRAVKPDAVKVHESGFEMVDYDRAMETA